jgi:hypothetical protein
LNVSAAGLVDVAVLGALVGLDGSAPALVITADPSSSISMLMPSGNPAPTSFWATGCGSLLSDSAEQPLNIEARLETTPMSVRRARDDERFWTIWYLPFNTTFQTGK